MRHTLRFLSVLIAVGVAGGTELHAQVLGPRQGLGEIVTINAYGGGFSPASTLTTDGGFDSSAAVGGAATLWLHHNVGVRGNVLFARTAAADGVPDAVVGEDPDVWAYSGDVVLRIPFVSPNGRDAWFPYLVGGLGAKTYAFDAGRETDFAGSFGGGLEYRLARWGIQAEVRDIVTRFDRFDVDKVQHDVVWTAGLTLSF
jgi:hypothetical protein